MTRRTTLSRKPAEPSGTKPIGFGSANVHVKSVLRRCTAGPFVTGTLAVATLIGCTVSANSQNLGDIPGNQILSATCPKVSYLGPTVTAYCEDRSHLMIKSSIDVRTCAGYLVMLDADAQLVCRQPNTRS